MKNETPAQAPDTEKQLDHKEWLKDKGITVEEMPEALQEAVDAVAQAKETTSPEDLAAANKELLEAIQEWYYQLDDQIENIGEVLHDHEERIEALESGEIAEKSDVTPGITPGQTPTIKLTDEQILAKLFSENVNYISKQELAALGFKTGFFSKLSARGADYGAYSLVKKPSEKTYQIVKAE